MKDKAGWNKYRHKRREIEPQETELVIESLTNSGDGLGRQDKRVVFVPYTAPGDKVRIKITQRKKTFAIAEIVELIEPSPDRVDAPCQYFRQCGGCDWQHIPYAIQLQAKFDQLQDTLQRIGMLDQLPIEPVLASKQHYAYRNRIQGEIRNGAFHYKRRRSDQSIAIARCEIAEDAINEFLTSNLTKTVQGRVELSVTEGTVCVLPVQDNNSTELGFRQVNTAVGDALTGLILENIDSDHYERIIDLYCGRGHWTNQIAQQHPQTQVIGVDSSADNIDIARQVAKHDGHKNTLFHHADVQRTLKKLKLANSVCIVDPPRSGLDASVIDHLLAEPCQRLIYVSCHPATLARDLKKLTEYHYVIKHMQPLDMFPQTAHLECLVTLNRRDLT